MLTIRRSRVPLVDGMLVSGLLSCWLIGASADAEAGPLSQAHQPSAPNCAALLRLDLERLPDAPTRITGARIVAASAVPSDALVAEGSATAADHPAKSYCQVTGYVAPQNKFELRLPVPSDWNHKFFFAACKGFCGAVVGSACNPGLARGYASVTTNGGHDGPPIFDGYWALNAPSL